MLPPLSWRSFLLEWQLDPAPVALVVVAGALYLAGVRRLERRAAGPSAWPLGRTASFGAGLAVLAYATCSGLGRYDTVLLSVHALQHVAVGMVGPFLLALGAPMTLALQASRRPTQVVLLRILHHPVVATLTHPLVAWTLFAGTVFGYYFSPLLDLSLRNPSVHALVHLHFVVVGMLFWWPAVGIDPARRPLPNPGRLLYILLGVPLHAFVGLAILSSTAHPLGADEYAKVARDWGPSLVADQRTAAGVMWASGELLGAVAAGVVATRWVREERRREQRYDRQAASEAPPTGFEPVPPP
jgi:putative membrane protein